MLSSIHIPIKSVEEAAQLFAFHEFFKQTDYDLSAKIRSISTATCNDQRNEVGKGLGWWADYGNGLTRDFIKDVEPTVKNLANCILKDFKTRIRLFIWRLIDTEWRTDIEDKWALFLKHLQKFFPSEVDQSAKIDSIVSRIPDIFFEIWKGTSVNDVIKDSVEDMTLTLLEVNIVPKRGGGDFRRALLDVVRTCYGSFCKAHALV